MPIVRFKNLFRGKPPKVDPTELVPGQLERLKKKIAALRANRGDISYSPKTGKSVPTAGGKGTDRYFTRFNKPGDQGVLPYHMTPKANRKGAGPGGGRYDLNPDRHGRDK